MSETNFSSTKSSKPVIKSMVPRDPEEGHRAATTLELLYDLCFVVAIAFAATGLHHALNHGHVLDGLISFILVFFAIWWAWMNFTWLVVALFFKTRPRNPNLQPTRFYLGIRSLFLVWIHSCHRSRNRSSC